MADYRAATEVAKPAADKAANGQEAAEQTGEENANGADSM
jgi:hypothetical protein